MANWNDPVLSTAYSSFLTALKDRDVDVATMYDVGSPTNVPTDAIKFAKSSGVFQKWTGAVWSTVQLKSAAIEDAAITTAKIGDAQVTGAKLASGAAATNLGFTPANKAGDTFTGAVQISMANPNLEFNETDNSNKKWGINTNGGTLAIYEDTTGTPRMTIAAGAGVLALGTGTTITFGGSQLWHGGNDGAGSGLDADTVDGQHLGTAATAQFAALGVGAANDGTQSIYGIFDDAPSNSARQIMELVGDNTTQTLTGNRAHHGSLINFTNRHFDASGFTLAVTGEEVNAVSGGTGFAAKADTLAGGYFSAQNMTDQATNNVVVNAYGLRSLLKSGHANALITTGYGLNIEVNAADAASITTAYLAYAAYTGTAPTNRRGIRLVGEDKSQFDGSLGLGIDPTQKLHVSGNGLFTGTLTTGSQVFGGGSQAATAPDFSFTGDTNTGMRRTGADTLALVTNDTDRLTIDSAGLVGIGTAPATYRLSVNGDVSATAFREGATLLSSTYARLGVANAFTAFGSTITAAALTAALTFSSTDATAADWPALILDRNSGSPAAADLLSSVVFRGKNSGAAAKDYANIQASIVDATASSEDGQLSLQTMVAGALATRAYVAQGAVIGSPTGGDKGTGSINASTIYWNGTSLAGKYSIPIGPTGFYTRSTNGATAYSSETGTNKVMVKGWSFDHTTVQYIQSRFIMPKAWNKGTFDLILRGVRPAGSSANQTRWGARAAILDSGDASDIAFGTAIEGNVTPSATALVKFEITLSAISPSGTVSAANSSIILEIYRDVADAADAENAQAVVIEEAILIWTASAPTDD